MGANPNVHESSGAHNENHDLVSVSCLSLLSFTGPILQLEPALILH